MENYYMDMDWNWDASLQSVCEALQPYSLRLESLAAKGPAGGNPLVRLHGTYDNLFMFMSRNEINFDLHPITQDAA